MIYEFCAENVTLLEKAMQAGARRIQLCDNLAVGGTTPSYQLLDKIKAFQAFFCYTIKVYLLTFYRVFLEI